MAEARMQDAWSRTSALMALVANCHRNPKRSRAFRPADFDPFSRSERPADLDKVRELFLRR